MNVERARGSLAGLAVGDALGTTLEFQLLRAPGFPQLAEGPHREITGGGPFGVEPGQVTDDTQMAAALAVSLRECRGFDAEDIARRYVAWRRCAFDIGIQTAACLDLLQAGVKPGDSGRDHWLRHGRRPAGNGALMRTAPIGVFFARDDISRREASLREAALTHYDPRCQLASAAFNAAIAAAVANEEPCAVCDLFESARRELPLAARRLLDVAPEERVAIEAAREALLEDLQWAEQPDPQLYPEPAPAGERPPHLHDTAGFVRVAFRLAFWELLHAPSLEAALVDVVNRGGDADTNAAITGALLGACSSSFPEPPARWRVSTGSSVDERGR